MSNIEQLKTEALSAIAGIDELKALDETRVHYLGKKGQVTQLLHGLKDLPAEERRDFGQAVNQLKQELQTALNERREALQSAALETALEKYERRLDASGDAGSA